MFNSVLLELISSTILVFISILKLFFTEHSLNCVWLIGKWHKNCFIYGLLDKKKDIHGSSIFMVRMKREMVIRHITELRILPSGEDCFLVAGLKLLIEFLLSSINHKAFKFIYLEPSQGVGSSIRQYLYCEEYDWFDVMLRIS